MTMGITIITTAKGSGKRWEETFPADKDNHENMGLRTDDREDAGTTREGSRKDAVTQRDDCADAGMQRDDREDAGARKGSRKDIVTITVDPESEEQTIEGFGGAFTDTAAAALRQMEPRLQRQALDMYFDREKGLGYNAGRVSIGSCDFSREIYSYDDQEGDLALRRFSVDCDRDGVIPFIQEAQETAGPNHSLELYALPWSPPAWMKTNRSMLNGGKLRREYYAVMADYIGRFVDAYRAFGIDIHAVTAQNEPNENQKWPSCLYTEEEERDFLRYLIPEMKKRGVSILCWDCNKDYMRKRVEFLMEDPEIRPAIDGVGFHWYSGGFYEELSAVHERYPELKLCATECCVVMPEKLDDWSVGERYVYDMMQDFNHGTCVWLDWNLYLDEESGPKCFENPCAAPIILDKKRQELIRMSSYYYIGHLSRYVEKGAVHIKSSLHTGSEMKDGSGTCTKNAAQIKSPMYTVNAKSGKEKESGLMCSAFRNPGGEQVVVVMNTQDQEQPVCIETGDRRCSWTMEGHSIATVRFA